MLRIIALYIYMQTSTFATSVLVQQGNGQINHTIKGSAANLDTLGGLANFLLSPYQNSVKIDYIELSPMTVYYHIPSKNPVTISSNEENISTEENEPLIGPVYNYPNPFTLEEGTTIGYKLREDTDLAIHIYNIFGKKIWSKKLKAGIDEGAIGSKYNKVVFNRSTIDNYELPSGIYFYIILSDNSVLAKGKMAIKP